MLLFRFCFHTVLCSIIFASAGCAVSSHNTRERTPGISEHRPASTNHLAAKPSPIAKSAVDEAMNPNQSSKNTVVSLASHTRQPPPSIPSNVSDQNSSDSAMQSESMAEGLNQLKAVPPTPGLPSDQKLLLQSIIDSVYLDFPLLEAAKFSRNVASGEQLAAWGSFDRKLKAASENGVTGFYETFRQNIGIEQPIYSGGNAFAGYRVGRGTFEPWYKERETNGGGEFKTGVHLPLLRNTEIDARRAELWRKTYGRQQVEPEIQAQLIGFVQEASHAYWSWVAAGTKYKIAKRVLELASDRTDRIRNQVEAGLIDPPELTDNKRLVAERQAKLAEAIQKFQKAAIKLSLYYRDANSEPMIVSPDMLPVFPEPTPVDSEDLALKTSLALQQRPEISVLNLYRRQLDVDLSEARNDFLPNLDTRWTASQDVGVPTSSKNDKGDFELEASLYLDVPLERRKARGKVYAVQGKMAQLQAKRRMTENKIVTDVQSAHASLIAAYQRVLRTREAVTLAEDLAQRERENQQDGLSDLLKVTLREQYAVEASEKAVDALEAYFKARADYRAAVAEDRVN